MNKVNCPKCNVEMDPGKVHIGATAIGFLVIGFSYKHLFFTNKKGEKEIAVKNDDFSKTAHKCPSCNGVFIE
jgi:hypothetical protein